MSADDRQRWNRRYATGSHTTGAPSSFLVESAGLLPDRGRALDVAGGAGRHAVWLARRGLQVTIVDVSDQGLELARQRAAAAAVDIVTERRDLSREPLPPGPWNVAICFHYLDRELFAPLVAELAPGGLLLFCQPTVRNLERHPRPGRRFLLEEGEGEALIAGAGLEILRASEGWSDEDRHEARVIGRRSGPAQKLGDPA